MSKSDKFNGLLNVKDHYEDYPYPYRDPNDENKRLLEIIGESLIEINHWCFKGKKDFKSNFRVLIAGGGTGDAVIFFAHQLRNTNAEVVYLDFSQASMEVAKKRAEVKGLKNITWIHDSILNIPQLNLGKFDFVNCSGVLHHLASPPDGLHVLRNLLKDDGVMNIMIYGKYGRTHIYQVQEIMRLVNENVGNRQEEVENCKKILASMPHTSWFKRGEELISDHVTFGDIGVYDLFLHKQDRAYSVPEMYDFINAEGLNFVSFSEPLARMIMNVRNFIQDPVLSAKVRAMDIKKQLQIAELMYGAAIKHTFYCSSNVDTVASCDDLDNIVKFIYVNAEFAKKVREVLVANGLGVGNIASVNVDLPTIFLGQKIILNFVIQETSLQILDKIDGQKTLREIMKEIISDGKISITEKEFAKQAKATLGQFFESGIFLLQHKNVVLPIK